MGQSPHEWNWCPYERAPCPSDTGGHSKKKQEALTKQGLCQSLDLGLASL